MRKTRIPSDGKLPPLTRLKLAAPDLREWAWGLSQTQTSAQARAAIAEKTGIELGSDTSYSEFLSWHFHQRRLENYNRLIEQFQDFYTQAKPDASREQVRSAGIAFFSTEAIANNDLENFVSVSKLGLAEEKHRIDQASLKLETEKFQFNAAEQCLAQLDNLKAIKTDSGLSEAQKVDAIRAKLFGQLPA